MVEIGRAIVSTDIFGEQFLCDLPACRGACCIEGDSGAPVTEEEDALIRNVFDLVRCYLPDEHIRVIEETGFSVIDDDGDRVTPLVNSRQCAYSFFDEKGILKCGIEKTFTEGKILFQKPLSCHLFPIRITSYKRFDAVNYQQIKACLPGRECGKKAGLPLYRFLKESLIRKYGNDWYNELEIAASHLKK